jgi:hypothetical protein
MTRKSLVEKFITMLKKDDRYLSWDKFKDKEEFRKQFNFQQSTRRHNVRMIP